MVGDSSGLGVYGVPQVNLILRSPLQFLGSYSVVGIGKFNLLFLWLFGGVLRGSWDLVTRVIIKVTVLITTYNPT